MNQYTADEIMERMGFPPTEQGHYVTLLRERVREQVANGLRDRGYGSWEGQPSCEVRARELLGMDWARERGHSYEVRAMDGLIRRRRNLSTGRFTYKIKWAWFGDRFRKAVMRFRVWRDRMLGVRNPYAQASHD